MLKERVSKIIRSFLIYTVASLILLFPTVAAESTVNSINVCLNSVIPSMFAFMVISTYIQNSGLYRTVFRPVFPLLKKIIKADDNILSIFLLSLIGGYPVGVKLLGETIAQNKNYHEIVSACEYASSFCYCISPAFAIIMIGDGVFGSTSVGGIIYLSNVLACLTVAVIVSRRTKLCSEGSVSKSEKGLTDAVNSASKSLFVICSIIIAFNILLSCITAAISAFGFTFDPMILGFFEISNLLRLSSFSLLSVPVISAIASMGGICVLIQCTAIIRNIFSVKKFIIACLPCMLLSILYSFLFLQLTDISVPVAALSSGYTYSFSANKIIVPILIAMCTIIFYKSDNFHKKV